MNQNDVEILSHEIVYKGYFQMDRYKLRFRLFAGGWSKPVVREVFERGDAAGVLLYDSTLDKVVLIEQFRVGALKSFEENRTPWLIELVAGIIEPDENVNEVVIRETKEEAGLELLDLEPICHYWVSPGGTSERISLFCGRVDAKDANGIHGVADEEEDIRINVMPFDEAYEKMKEGLINNASTIIALQWLKLTREILQKKWNKL